MAIKFQDLVKKAETEHKRIRIVYVLPCLNAGGAERVSISLMNGLDRTRFEPHLISLTSEGPLRDWISDDVTFHGLGRGRVSRSLFKLARKLRKLKPDIVVSSMAHMNFGILILKPLLPATTKIFVREANIPSSIAEAQKTPWLVRQAYRRLYKKADKIISPAQCIINEFYSYVELKTDNHVLLHNPVDLKRIRNETHVLQHVDDKRRNQVHFICSGRLHTQKGFDRLISALSSFQPSYDWRLTILGEGHERVRLEELVVKHDLAERVFLPGHTKNPWLEYAKADCFLLPSRWEGLPNVALESLAVGTPVIASAESGGIQEIADLSSPGNVTVCPNMDCFITAMQGVKPIPTTTMRPSLLNDHFTMDAVIDRFTDILENQETPLNLPEKPLLKSAETKKAA